MMRRNVHILFGAAALALGLAACGGNDRQCATGTIPDPGGADTCVPDGTVVCGNGTMYDQTSGTCVATDQCPTGEALVNGTCTPNVTPNAEEAPEPNDTTSAGTIMVPAIGAAPYVVHGCITPRDNSATADMDPWQVTVTGPTLLDVTSNGVGGLAAGFVAAPNDPNLAALKASGWVRFGINLVDTTSHRQLFLPAAGTYNLIMSDSRQLFLGNAPAGSDKSCYFTIVSQLALPTPTPVSSGAHPGTIQGDVQAFSVTLQEGDLVDAQNDMSASTAAVPAVVLLKNNAYGNANDGASGTPAEAFMGGFKASDSAVVVVDTEYNYGLAAQAYTLNLLQLHAKALPATGTVTDMKDPTYFSFAYFDVANDGDLVHFDLTFAPTPGVQELRITDSNLTLVSELGAAGGAFTGWVHFAKAGRYYVVYYYDNSVAAGATTTITSNTANVTPATLTTGTPITAKPLPTLGSDWLAYAPTGQTWIATAATGTGFTGNIDVAYYDSTKSGLIGQDITPVTGMDYQFPQAGTASFGRITFGDPTTYFVGVSDVGATTGTKSYTLNVAPQTYTDLGKVDETTPQSKTGENLGGANKTKLYFVQGNSGDKVTIVIHPTAGVFKATARWLDVDQVARATATAAAGADVTLITSVGAGKYIAFAVTGTGATTTYDVNVTATAPVNYTQAAGSLTFTDACAGGTTIATLNGGGNPDNDEGLSAVQTMPFAFSLFGDAVTKYTISTNGWLAFVATTDPAYANQQIPNEAPPNGVLAPFWTDLAGVVVCKAQTATTVTVQWSGATIFGLGPPAEMQVVMHSNGVIDYIYSANQADDGSDATVGLENIFGTFGRQVGFNQPGTITPSSSITFTPAP
jgi:hypothetical protein